MKRVTGPWLPHDACVTYATAINNEPWCALSISRTIITQRTSQVYIIFILISLPQCLSKAEIRLPVALGMSSRRRRKRCRHCSSPKTKSIILALLLGLGLMARLVMIVNSDRWRRMAMKTLGDRRPSAGVFLSSWAGSSPMRKRMHWSSSGHPPPCSTIDATIISNGMRSGKISGVCMFIHNKPSGFNDTSESTIKTSIHST